MKHSLRAALAATVGTAAFVVALSAPAQALIIGGKATYTNSGAMPTDLTVSNEFNNADLTGGFTNVTGLLVNSVTIVSNSTPPSGFNAKYNFTSAFLSGFQYSGVAAVMNLLPGDLVNQTNGGGYIATTAFDFTGEIRSLVGSSLLGTVTGNFSANKSPKNDSNFSLNLDATAVPTPALLPGLVGMGIAAVRRQRKQTAELA
jgi:hypothetical protein